MKRFHLHVSVPWPLKGQWRDVLLGKRRSARGGID